MPWNNQSGGPWGGGGGQGGGGSPWGSGGGNNGGGWGGGNRGGGGQPPDLEKMLRRGQDRLKKVLPGGGGSGISPLGVGILIAVGLIGWLLTGIYTVRQNEVAINLVFGQFVGIERPGLKYNWPAPIGAVEKVAVTTINQMEVGGLGQGTQQQRTSAGGDESLMLTSDGRIIDIDFTVFWKIKDTAPQDFVFNLVNPENTIRAVAQSAMREVVGRGDLDRIVSGDTARTQVEQDVRTQMQAVLDSYQAGISVEQISLRTADVPQPVVDSFRDVQAAQQDAAREQLQAETDRSRIIPEAEAVANRLIALAEGFLQSTVAQATGQAARFRQVYDEYVKAPDVTRERLFFETWERFFSATDKIIIDQPSGNGVLPFLPLEPQGPARQGQPSPLAPSAAAGQSINPQP
jgi:membrane protease subunit HflK